MDATTKRLLRHLQWEWAGHIAPYLLTPAALTAMALAAWFASWHFHGLFGLKVLAGSCVVSFLLSSVLAMLGLEAVAILVGIPSLLVWPLAFLFCLLIALSRVVAILCGKAHVPAVLTGRRIACIEQNPDAETLYKVSLCNGDVFRVIGPRDPGNAWGYFCRRVGEERKPSMSGSLGDVIGRI